MHTDISLRVLTMERGHDLFPLLGIPETTTLERVHSLDLPAISKRLDNILHLVTPEGHHHNHLVEWHGWKDPAVLWRVTGYLCWNGEQNPETPLTVTLVYLTPASDMGDTITQTIGSTVMFTCTVHCVRLWKLSAADALAMGLPGLAVLSPLMGGASVETVHEAATIIRRTTSKPQQDNLLTILGAFSVPLVESPEQLIHLIGKEPIVDSELFTTLFEERYAQEVLKYREQLAAKDEELDHKDKELYRKDEELYRKNEELYRKDEELDHKNEELYRKDRALHDVIQSMQRMVEQTLVTRFPQTPTSVIQRLQQMTNTEQLHMLMHAITIAQSISDVEQAMQQLEERSQN
jgi:hypothetical protein